MGAGGGGGGGGGIPNNTCKFRLENLPRICVVPLKSGGVLLLFVSIFPWVELLFCFLPFDTWGQLGALEQHLRVSRQDQRSDSWHCRMIARLKSVVSNLLALY